MSQVYNTFNDIANSFRSFLSTSCQFLPKPVLKIMPEVLASMVSSLSSNSFHIALGCKGEKFDFIQPDSVHKRVRRFFNNHRYNPYQIYDAIIKHVISKFSPHHGDNRIHIVIDHMFKDEHFVTLMITLRIGRKSVPLWFRCFDKGHSSDEAFKESLIIDGIQYVSDLFKDRPEYQLIFLADRWFNSSSLLDFIDSLGHTYTVRAKSGSKVKFFDNKEGHFIWKEISDLFHYTHKATYYKDISYTRGELNTNIVFSATSSVSIKSRTESGKIEPWMILTNGDVKRAIKDYHYRFGAIGFLFKDQKSNGFNLQKSNTSMRSLQSYSMMYTCMCICMLFLTCVGTYYTRHKGKYLKFVKLRYHGIVSGKSRRSMSLFRVGHALIRLARDSLRYIKIPFNFVLTDV